MTTDIAEPATTNGRSVATQTGAKASLVVAEEPRSEFDKILALAENPNIPIDRIAAVIDLFRGVEKDRSRRSFDDAMANAKAEFPPILKNRTVEHDTKGGGKKRYNHEDLFGIASIVDPILGKHGLSYRFRVTSEIGQPIVVTCVVTGFGHSEETTLHGGRDDSGNKNAMQAIGSSLTYLQRYSLKAALGLSAGHDDDGKSSETTESDFITDEQADEILGLIQASGANYQSFLKIAKAETVSDIRTKDFSGLKLMLDAKLGNGKSNEVAA